MKRTYRHLFSIIAVFGFIAMAVATSEDKKEKEVIKVDIDVTSQQLYQAYQDNEVAADETYKDQYILVTGNIKDIGKDIMGDPFVSLEGDDFIGVVQCMFEEDEAKGLSSLKKGEKVSIVGKCSGKLMNVILRDSRLHKN